MTDAFAAAGCPDTFGIDAAAAALHISVRRLRDHLGALGPFDDRGEVLHWRTGRGGRYCFDAGCIERLKRMLAMAADPMDLERASATGSMSPASPLRVAATRSARTRETKAILAERRNTCA